MPYPIVTGVGSENHRVKIRYKMPDFPSRPFFSVSVITPTGTICRAAKRLKSPPQDALISNLVTEETGCGLPNTPYILEVPQGQTINLNLLDFHVDPPGERSGRLPGPEIQPLGCDVYTTLKEPKTSRAVDVCGGRERHNIIFKSRTNIVEIIIHNAQQNKHYFLLKYEGKCPHRMSSGLLGER